MGVFRGYIVLTPHLLVSVHVGADYMECDITSGELSLRMILDVAGNCPLLLHCPLVDRYTGTGIYPLPTTRDDDFTNLTCALACERDSDHSVHNAFQGMEFHSIYNYDLKCVKCSSSFQVKEV